jgi:hypothetical protein
MNLWNNAIDLEGFWFQSLENVLFGDVLSSKQIHNNSKDAEFHAFAIEPLQ